MELHHEFTVPVPVGKTWQALLDIERVAPCMPGASVDDFDGRTINGSVKVAVGPVTVTYRGTAVFDEQDETAHRVGPARQRPGDAGPGHRAGHAHRHARRAERRYGRVGADRSDGDRPSRPVRPGRPAGGQRPAGGRVSRPASRNASPSRRRRRRSRFWRSRSHWTCSASRACPSPGGRRWQWRPSW